MAVAKKWHSPLTCLFSSPCAIWELGGGGDSIETGNTSIFSPVPF